MEACTYIGCVCYHFFYLLLTEMNSNQKTDMMALQLLRE